LKNRLIIETSQTVPAFGALAVAFFL